MLNRGGVANSDVLLLRLPDLPATVVKDYGERPVLIRLLLAPLLVRRELALLRRVEGLPGVPRQLGRIDRLAFAMEYIEGHPLDRRTDAHQLEEAFFDALQGILDGLSLRGLCYLDLRGSANVVRTPSEAPALIDLASATVVWIPLRARRWLERRALAKLRARFSVDARIRPAPAAKPGEQLVALGNDVRAGRLRLRYRDQGQADDPAPVVLIHDAGLSSATFEPILASAARAGRRAIALDLPGCGLSAQPVRGYELGRQVLDVLHFLRALRLGPVDLVGMGFGSLIARAVRARSPGSVRSVVALDPPGPELSEPFQARWRAALEGAESIRRLLTAEVESNASAEVAAALAAAVAGASDRALTAPYRSLRVQGDPPHLSERGLGPRPDLELRNSGDPATEPLSRLWQELSKLASGALPAS